WNVETLDNRERQVAWYRESQFDPLPPNERARLGLDVTRQLLGTMPVRLTADDPRILVQTAEAEERAAIASPKPSDKYARLQHALALYTKAVQRASDSGWPQGYVRPWRYRRATLVRVLDRLGTLH